MKKYRISETDGEKTIRYTFLPYKIISTTGAIFVVLIITLSFLSYSEVAINGHSYAMEPTTKFLWLVILFSVMAIICIVDNSSLNATISVRKDGSLVVYKRKWLFSQKKYDLERGQKPQLVARSMFLWKMYALSVQFEQNGQTHNICITPSRTSLYITKSGWGLTLNKKEIDEISKGLNLPIMIVE